MNKEAQETFEQIKANVLDRSLFERERPAFMRELLPKIAPDFDWKNFYYAGCRPNGTIVLCFMPNSERLEIPLERFDLLYLNLVEETYSIKKENGDSLIKRGSICATQDLAKNLYECDHGYKKKKALGKFVKWFYKENLINSSVKNGTALISIQCDFIFQTSVGHFTKTFYAPNNATIEEAASFLYLHNRLPTRAEAGKWYHEKRSKTCLFGGQIIAK